MVDLQKKVHSVQNVVAGVMNSWMPSLLEKWYFQKYPHQNMLEVFYEIITYILHVCDREVFRIFGPEKRRIIMDQVLNNIHDGIIRHIDTKNSLFRKTDLQNIYNKRQIEYSFYKERLTEKEKSPKHTLAWEFAKNILHDKNINPVAMILLASDASNVANACRKALRRMLQKEDI
jgi:SHS2 domain-containing protein